MNAKGGGNNRKRWGQSSPTVRCGNPSADVAAAFIRVPLRLFAVQLNGSGLRGPGETLDVDLPRMPQHRADVAPRHRAVRKQLEPRLAELEKLHRDLVGG
jgi:hypothetical protein